MVDTPRKTFPELQALTAPVVDSDVLAVYRSPGPAKRTTASVFSDYIKAFFSASGGSALVGFLQAGVGALTRTMQAKMRETISLSDYAVGDGVTDDTAAIQALINANFTRVTISGAGKAYKVSSAIEIPFLSRFLKIHDLALVPAGDNEVIKGQSGGTSQNFVLEDCLIDCQNHTTVGRKCIDFSLMSYFEFNRVQVFSKANVTTAFYGAGGTGAGPYYGTISHSQTGQAYRGVDLADGSGPALAANTLTIRETRSQPGSGNVGIYVGLYCQNIRIRDCCFEAPTGGSGIVNYGASTIVSGGRFESMTIAVDNKAAATNLQIYGGYYDSNGANLVDAGTGTTRIELAAVSTTTLNATTANVTTVAATTVTATTFGSVGNCVPELTGSSTAGSTTYGGARFGYFDKIGRSVFIEALLPWTATTATGFLEIVLPTGFVFKSGNILPGFTIAVSDITYSGTLVALGLAGTDKVRLYSQTSAGALGAPLNITAAPAATVYISGWAICD